MLIVVLVVVAAGGLQYLLPPLKLKGTVYTYLAPEMHGAFLPLVLVPVFLLLAPLARTMAAQVVQAILLIAIAMAAFVWSCFPLAMGPTWIGFFTAAAWLLKASVLAYVCFRKDLVAQ